VLQKLDVLEMINLFWAVVIYLQVTDLTPGSEVFQLGTSLYLECTNRRFRGRIILISIKTPDKLIWSWGKRSMAVAG
jgi:hypothetical protein